MSDPNNSGRYEHQPQQQVPADPYGRLEERAGAAAG